MANNPACCPSLYLELFFSPQHSQSASGLRGRWCGQILWGGDWEPNHHAESRRGPRGSVFVPFGAGAPLIEGDSPRYGVPALFDSSLVGISISATTIWMYGVSSSERTPPRGLTGRLI